MYLQAVQNIQSSTEVDLYNALRIVALLLCGWRDGGAVDNMRDPVFGYSAFQTVSVHDVCLKDR